MNVISHGSPNSSHVFYIILTILCSILILNIIEKQILITIEEKKKKF